MKASKRILTSLIKMTFILVPLYLGITLNIIWLEVVGIGIMAGIITE